MFCLGSLSDAEPMQTIANSGDIAGMGADLFGSFAESTCAALVIAAAAVEGSKHTLSAAGWETWLCGPLFRVVGVFTIFS